MAASSSHQLSSTLGMTESYYGSPSTDFHFGLKRFMPERHLSKLFFSTRSRKCWAVSIFSCTTTPGEDFLFAFIESATLDSSLFSLSSLRSGIEPLPKGRRLFVVVRIDFYCKNLTKIQIHVHSLYLRGPHALSWICPCYHFGFSTVDYCPLFSQIKRFLLLILKLPSVMAHEAGNSRTLLFVLISRRNLKQIVHSSSCRAVND